MERPGTPGDYDFRLAYPTRVAGQTDNLTLYDVLNYGYDLGLSDYPIWDEERRRWLNGRIIDHFLFRELGCETVTQFIFYLNRNMREKMPAINPVFDALDGMDGEGIRRSGKYSTDSTSASTGTGENENRAYASTNPRQTMVGKDPTEYYDSGTYSTGTSKSTSDGTANETGQTWGGYPTDATNRWYAGVNNALSLVFDAVEPCFSHIWKDHFNAF